MLIVALLIALAVAVIIAVWSVLVAVGTEAFRAEAVAERDVARRERDDFKASAAYYQERADAAEASAAERGRTIATLTAERDALKARTDQWDAADAELLAFLRGPKWGAILHPTPKPDA